uniref:Acetyltransferase component of pyruvate dehydrogenase complex n=1 Tax=Rhizophora mucronata TaxID=61149 RepID=A0A2P2N318_RHIMU
MAVTAVSLALGILAETSLPGEAK